MQPNTSFCNKNSLSYQRKYDGEIVENRKVGNPVVFLWEAFWPERSKKVGLEKGLFSNITLEIVDILHIFFKTL
jgi:hypothetical protein